MGKGIVGVYEGEGEVEVRMWDQEHCPTCGSTELRDKGSFDKCMDCGSRISFPEFSDSNNYPAHQQLADVFKNAITSSMIEDGEPILDQQSLAKETGLSEGTIQKCFALLESEGLVEALFSEGVFVKKQTAPVRSAPIDTTWPTPNDTASINRLKQALAGPTKATSQPDIKKTEGPRSESVELKTMAARIPVLLHKQIRIWALENNTSVAQLLTQLLGVFLNQDDGLGEQLRERIR